MAWLIGIICVIIVIVFWRIFLPLAAIAGIGLGLFLWNENYKQEKIQEKANLAAEEIRKKIATAKQNEFPIGNEWQIYYEDDPASKLPIARTASIKSDDGLCFLSVQKRLDGSELTGLNCPGIEISPYKNMDIKFDTDETSKKIRLEKYSDSKEVYIPSYQYSGQLDYKSFIGMFSKAKSLAIQIPASEIFWTKFNLKGAPEAIAQLGKAKGQTSQTIDPLIEGAKQCTRYLQIYEHEYAIPTHLLSAIASTESGRYHDGLKIKLPWPWTINAEGKGYFFNTKEEAIAAAHSLQALGVKSMDIGCMLVNIQQHPDAFSSLSQAFEPENNIAYAASFLRKLYQKEGSWKQATIDYHSKNPQDGQVYVGKIYANWYNIVERLKNAHLNVPTSSLEIMKEMQKN